MPRHVERFESCPGVLDDVAIGQDTIDTDRVCPETGEVVALWLGDDLGEGLVDPGLGAMLALEPRDAGEVVVVVVARDRGEDPCDSRVRMERVERVRREPLVRKEM